MVKIMVRFPVEVGDVCLLVSAMNGAGTHLASCWIGRAVCFPGDKTAGSWSAPFTT